MPSKETERADIVYGFDPELEQIGVSVDSGRILEPIEQRLAEYSPKVCERKIERSCRDFCDFANRIWRCWSYHWLKSNPTIDEGEVILQTVEQGKSYPDGNNLDGNPIHDVTLAEAMGKSENKAWNRFEQMFERYLGDRVRRIESAEDWWNDFLTYLGGYGVAGRSARKIDQYEGKVGLRRWLSVVVYNFLRERRRVDSRYRRRFSFFPDDWINQLLSPQHTSDALEDPIAELVRESFLSLPDELRGTLLFLYVGKLKVQQVAAIYHVDPGTVSRRRKQAIFSFRQELDQRILRLKGGLQSGDLFSEIIRNRETFIDMLVEQFESLCRERIPDDAEETP